jgi:hypothetical protein
VEEDFGLYFLGMIFHGLEILKKSFTAELAENAEFNYSKDKIQKSQMPLGYFDLNSSLRPLRSLR